MTTIYFVRHAEPNYQNHDDLSRELTPKGLEDRKKVTAFLESRSIHAVLSSPCLRAIQTVEHFANSKGLSIQVVEAFRERTVTDCWIPDFQGYSQKQWADFSYKLPGGESLGEVQRRNIAALRQVLEQYQGQNIAIGSHGTALSTIVNYYDPSFGFPDFEAIREVMPWVVAFTFEGTACQRIETFDFL